MQGALIAIASHDPLMDSAGQGKRPYGSSELEQESDGFKVMPHDEGWLGV